MIITSLFIILAAVALPSVRSTPALLTRTRTLVLLSSALVSSNIGDLTRGLTCWSGLIQITPITFYRDILILVRGRIALTPWASFDLPNSKTRGRLTIRTYPVFIIFTTFGSLCLVSRADLITLYLAIELQSFRVYILRALYRDYESATHAGLLYFLLGGLSSSLILLGRGIIYAYTGLTSLESIWSLISVEGSYRSVTLGFTILAVGLFFKVTAAPFHNWGPDVYDGVPTIVTTWLAVLPKISILSFLLEMRPNLSNHSLDMVSDFMSYNAWTLLLLTSSLISLVRGTVVGLAQTRIKRLLAYSTVSHIGFLFLALSVHSEERREAYIFYLVSYTATRLTRFMTILAIGYATRTENRSDISEITELTGITRSHPLLALSLALCLFSIRGVPPLVGFFRKMSVLYTAIHAGYTFMAIRAVVVSVISASYYLRVIRVVHNSESIQTREITRFPVTYVHTYLVSLLTLSLTLFLASPDILLNSVRLIALATYSN